MEYVGGKDQPQIKLKVTRNHTNSFFISLNHSPIEIGLYERTVLKREKSSQIYCPIEEIWIAGRVCSLAIAINLKDNQAWPK